MTIKEQKAVFLAKGVNAFAAAMLRHKIYATGKDTPANRQKLHDTLDKCVADMLKKGGYKKGNVSERQHYANIDKLSRAVVGKCRDFLFRKRFRIGAAQKFLNVRLKELWCAGKIKTPPHCPFDRIVIGALPAKALKGAVVNWTEANKIDDYKAWVAAFDDDRDNMLGKMGLRGKDATMSAWELCYWNMTQKRRNAMVRKYNKERRKQAKRGE
ncbi:MAG: hypothetical protein ACR2P4_04095 [Gammaproteobacteria bacterium]